MATFVCSTLNNNSCRGVDNVDSSFKMELEDDNGMEVEEVEEGGMNNNEVIIKEELAEEEDRSVSIKDKKFTVVSLADASILCTALGEVLMILLF